METFESIKGRIKIIAKMIKEGAKNVKLKNYVIENIIKSFNGKSIEQIKEVYDFVFNKRKYVNDIKGIDVFTTAEKMLELWYGDCDDWTIFLGSIYRCLGYDVAICNADTGRGYPSHIFLSVIFNNQYIWCDVSTLQYSFNYLPNYNILNIYFLI